MFNLIFWPPPPLSQTLLVLSSLSAIALVLSLLVIISFLIHYCCCRRGDRSEGSEEEEEDEEGSTGHGYGGKKGRGICCVTWVSVAAVTLCWWVREVIVTSLPGSMWCHYEGHCDLFMRAIGILWCPVVFVTSVSWVLYSWTVTKPYDHLSQG